MRSLGPAGDRVSVSLLTGFLGSGKTTLLNRLVKHDGLGTTAVIINELGEIALDHLLVERSTEEMIVLSSGCVCCSVRNDLLETLNGLWEKRAAGEIPRFDRVLIETTGLADPAPILKTILTDDEMVERYWLDSVVTTVDAANAATTLDRQFESIKQIAIADRLLLTKTDLVGDTTALVTRLRALNPVAPLIETAHGEVEPAALFDAALFDRETGRAEVDCWLGDDAFEDEHHTHEQSPHDDAISAFCLTWDEPLSLAAFERWMTELAHIEGPDLLRVKGIVNLAELDKPTVVHWVQHTMHPPAVLDGWPTSDRRTRMVFVTRGIDNSEIAQMLDRALDAG